MASHATGDHRCVRRVLVASPRSFCAGVERAIETVAAVLDTAAGPVYVRHEIVHNTHVVADLAARGAIFVRELGDIPDPPPEGSVVVFSAHGVSPQVRAEAARRRLMVVDATCPLVTKVHSEVRRFAARGDTIVLIGHADHEEVQGTRGEAPDSVIVIDDAAAVPDLHVADPDKVAYLTQTTLAVEETTQVIDALAARFPVLSGPGTDDICYATTNRQRALAEVAAEADVVLVIGSANSSNSVRLVELSDRVGTPAHLIDGPDDIDPAWLDGAETVGVTAGASAPPQLVDAVISRLRAVYGQQHHIEVIERGIGEETVHFALPAPVRHHRPVDHGPIGKAESE